MKDRRFLIRLLLSYKGGLQYFFASVEYEMLMEVKRDVERCNC